MREALGSEGSSLATSPGGALVRALGVAGAGLAAGVVLSLFGLFLLRGILGDLGMTTVIVATIVLTQGVAFGGTALVYVRTRHLPGSFIPVRFPSVRDLGWIVAGYIAAFVAVGIGAVLVSLTDASPASNQVGELGVQNPELLLLLIPLSILLVGPGEELLFRGVVQGVLRQTFGPTVAVVIAAAIFASIHFVALSGGVGARLVTITVLFLPSLVFGAVYEWSRNLLVPALIHGTYNATLFAGLYMAVQMGEVTPPG